MKRISTIFSIIYFIWTTAMLILILKGKVTFGHGLGDFFYLILLLILLIVFAYLFFLNMKKKISLPIIISFIQVVIIVLFMLKMTVWRGIEYPWNGSVFFE